MSQIKGWKKRNDIVWVNRCSKREVMLDKNSDGYGVYFGRGEGDYRQFRTKAEAKEILINHLKRNEK